MAPQLLPDPGVVASASGDLAAGLCKRAAAAAAAMVFTLILCPLPIMVAIVIRLDSPGPALFRQRRIGRGSREFMI